MTKFYVVFVFLIVINDQSSSSFHVKVDIAVLIDSHRKYIAEQASEGKLGIDNVGVIRRP